MLWRRSFTYPSPTLSRATQNLPLPEFLLTIQNISLALRPSEMTCFSCLPSLPYLSVYFHFNKISALLNIPVSLLNSFLCDNKDLEAATGLRPLLAALWASNITGALPSRDLFVFNNPEALWTLSFQVFIEASLCGHDWLNHWLLVINSTSCSSPCPGGQCIRLKVPNLNEWGWFSWQPAPILKPSRALPKIISLT